MSLQANAAALGIAACFAAACSGCHAQAASNASAGAWPNKPIRMLVSFPAGGPTDIVARLVSDKLAQQLGGRVIVDNRPGAAGNIAVEILAKSNADGHTLLYSSNAIALSPGLYTKLGYDPLKDIAPVTEVGAGCLIFLVHPSLPVKTVQ
ncbi:MAG TPA: tripartite tricarboxylate transporter substrate-binding protein, partial [Burkholderiales bacterium]|nr:tripartite tricarboxylate transporter substrate-binding protein [Burkholderiales bacterium]